MPLSLRLHLRVWSLGCAIDKRMDGLIVLAFVVSPAIGVGLAIGQLWR